MLRRIAGASRFAAFVVAGGIAALVNFVSRIAFSEFLGYAPAIVLAYLAGMATAFLLNRQAVFPPSGKPWQVEALWFTGVNVLALAQTLIVSVVLADHVLPAVGVVAFRNEIAHACGIAVPIVSSYFGHRHGTFGRRSGRERGT